MITRGTAPLAGYPQRLRLVSFVLTLRVVGDHFDDPALAHPAMTALADHALQFAP